MKGRSVFGQTLVDGCTTMINEICWGGAIAYFYTRNLGLPMKAMALVWGIFSVWNALDNFIVGYLTDRIKNQGGKRVKAIRTAGPVVGVLFALVFIKMPFITSQTELAVYVFVMICLLDFAIAFLEVSIFALPIETTLEDRGRGKIYFLESLIDVVVLVVPLYLIPALRPKDGESTLVFSCTMCGIGVLIGLITFIGSFFIEETPEAAKADAGKQMLSLPEATLGCMKNRAFWFCELFSVSLITAFSIFTVGMYYYFDEIVCSELLCYISLVLGVLFMLLASLFLHKKLGTKWLCVLCAGVSGGGMLAGMLCGESLLTGAFAFFGAGCAFIGNMYLLSFMMGDVADYDAFRNNIHREGIFYGIDTVFCSISNATQALFMVFLLALGYVEDLPAGMQTPAAQEGILLSWLLIPSAVLLAAAILIALFYPLDKKRVESIKCAIAERNAEKVG